MADPVWFSLAVRGIVGVLVLSVLLMCHSVWLEATRKHHEGSDRRDDSHTGLD